MELPRIIIPYDLSKSDSFDYITEYVRLIEMHDTFKNNLIESIEDIYANKIDTMYTYSNIYIMNHKIKNKCELQIINLYNWCSKKKLHYTKSFDENTSLLVDLYENFFYLPSCTIM